MVSFQSWWESNYEGKLGFQVMESSFREVAVKAWYSLEKDFETFWSDNYGGQLGGTIIEASFKEVAEKAFHFCKNGL